MRLTSIATLSLTGLILFLSSCEGGRQPVIYPETDWAFSPPAQQGVDSAGLEKAIRYLGSKCFHDSTREVVIIRNGYLIYAGDHADSVHSIWSCSKTFTSTVLGLLQDEGKVSLKDHAADYEPLLRVKYPGVTFRHFTTMTSGYDAVGTNRHHAAPMADWSATVYDPGEPFFPPGTAFAYWDEAQMMFARVLTQVVKMPLESFLKEKVTRVMGMDWYWITEKDLDGIPVNNGCTGVNINARKPCTVGLAFSEPW